MEEKRENKTPAPPTFWLLIGLIGSGKTTFSRKLWARDPQNTIRVCLDDIIQMMSFYNYSLELKPLYGEFERIPIVKGLLYGYNVVVDRTNLTREIRAYFLHIPRKIRELASGLYDVILSEERGLFPGNRERLVLAVNSFLEGQKAGEKDEDIVGAFLEIIEKKLDEAKEIPLFGEERIPGILEHLDRLKKLRIVGVYFDIPPDVCLERRLKDPMNRFREQTRKVDWKNVLDKMLMMLEIPSLEEGFDEILYVDETGNVRKS